ncbi:MAG: Fic family protein [Candidatus Omnitrophica bacterium]|nr:Fic family protein [Candidatus Omnitrophota bacterium]
MKIPEKAPNWIEIFKTNKVNMVELATSSEMSSLVEKANREYVYWDKFKYFTIPENISKEIAWVYLKVNRLSQIRKIPILDTKNNKFGYWLPDAILKELHYIDQYAGGQILVDYPSIQEGQKERYLISSIMEEAIASSQLEGAVTTRKKAKEMLRSGRKPETHAEHMILNNYNTIKNIKIFIKEPLTPELLNNLQASITKDTLEDPSASGRFRSENETVQVIDNENHILHIPPPANELQERIKVLCEYVNKEQEDIEFIHPVIKAIILHFWLAYIHPFVDGNGRTARALFYWYMLKNKYWMFEYLSISRIIVKAPAQYARAYLYSEMEDQDLAYYISLNLRTIHLAIEVLLLYLAKQQKELSETVKFLRDYPGLNYRQYDILYHALSHPDAMYTIEYHKNNYGIVYQTARTDLIDLATKGLLEQEKRGKLFYFIPSSNIHKKLRHLKKKI